MKSRCYFVYGILFLVCCAQHDRIFAQEQNRYQVYAVGFYNLENLFDAEDDPDNRGDDEYTPGGALGWTPDKYRKKLNNMGYAISQLAREHCPFGPVVLGVAEVENRSVLEDLVATRAMSDMNYNIVHYDSPDRRGIDVALLYNPGLFQVISSKIYPYRLADDSLYRTRDQLLVSGTMAGENVHIIVAHWPSRYGGARSSRLREHAASIARHIIDSLHQDDSNAKVIFMGDLNDDPNDVSVRVVLDARKKQDQVKKGGLYNPMWQIWEKGVGSLAYQGQWNLFDQIIISETLLGKDRSTLKFWRAEVFNRDFLIENEGKNRGYPFRTYSNNTFINGYSDHFPTLIYLVKSVE